MFERGIESRHLSFEIHGQQTDVDRLDDRLVEFLQKLQLGRAFLLVLVEQTVFNRDRDVTRDGTQNLDVFG